MGSGMERSESQWPTSLSLFQSAPPRGGRQARSGEWAQQDFATEFEVLCELVLSGYRWSRPVQNPVQCGAAPSRT